MDQKELQEKIALYYSKLPPNVQAVFSSMSWLETLKEISQRYGLNQQQIETLGTETTLVLLGIIHLVEYEEALTNELGLSRNSAEKILMEIEESIIKNIRPQLVLAFEANKKSETEKTPNVEQKLDARFKKLPKEIENIIKESNYQETLYNIAKEHNLTVLQMGSLETTVIDLIVGAIHPEEFENYLEKNLELPLETVRKIANDVNEKIFLKIRELLKLMNTPEGEIPSVEKTTEETQNNETQVLNSAGVEIVPEKLELGTAEKPTENREDILEKIEKPETINKMTNYELQIDNKEETHPILAQKLSGSLQTGVVKTEHTLQNLSSNDKENLTTTTSKKPKIDPYREVPE